MIVSDNLQCAEKETVAACLTRDMRLVRLLNLYSFQCMRLAARCVHMPCACVRRARLSHSQWIPVDRRLPFARCCVRVAWRARIPGRDADAAPLDLRRPPYRASPVRIADPGRALVV